MVFMWRRKGRLRLPWLWTQLLITDADISRHMLNGAVEDIEDQYRSGILKENVVQELYVSTQIVVYDLYRQN